MTAETAEGTSASTELEPVAQGALALVQGDKPWTVFDLAEKLAGPARESKDLKVPAPAPKVKFTDRLRKALKSLPEVFGQVMPDEVRVLDRHELKAVTDEAVTISAVKDELGKRLDSLKETVRNHMDMAAEAAGLPQGASRVAGGAAEGHWLLASDGEPHNVPVDGYADPWQQKKVKGQVTVKSTPQDLLDLLITGAISRDEYLSFTEMVRVYSPDKAQAFIRKNPVRGLEILARMTTRSAPSASLVSPKK